MHSDPSQVQPQPEKPAATPTPTPGAPRPKKKSGIKILFLILLLLAVGVLGYFTFQTVTNLKAEQAALAVLQGKYDDLAARNAGLKSEYTQVSGELASTTAELNTTREALKTAQSDLSKTEQEASTLQTKKEKSSQLVEIMVGVFKDLETPVESYLKVLTTGDDMNSELYNIYMKTKSSTDLFNWIGYVISKSIELIK